jgi:hypothetical protein
MQVRLTSLDSFAEIVVTDSGVGISPEFLPHVFERFRQADSRFAREHGGLGLAIAREIVHLHGGSIEAASDGEGKGATFTVTLPLIRAAGSGIRPFESLRAANDSSSAIGGSASQVRGRQPIVQSHLRSRRGPGR